MDIWMYKQATMFFLNLKKNITENYIAKVFLSFKLYTAKAVMLISVII